tara:strand:+ start:3062 stop:3301 length:240 start_codon:yes stop_codon:yes gene_type:complete
MKKKVKLSYYQTDQVFGNYDIMFPQTEEVNESVVEFDGDVELKEYFNQFVHWLTEIGFSKTEIHAQITRYCHYQDEITP